MRTITMAAALVVSLSANAGAQEILAGGSLFASPAQNTAVCYVYNAGTTSLTLSGAKLSNFAGTTLALNINTCTGALAAGEILHFRSIEHRRRSYQLQGCCRTQEGQCPRRPGVA